jgi:hypothetical protein
MKTEPDDIIILSDRLERMGEHMQFFRLVAVAYRSRAYKQYASASKACLS